MLDSLEELVVDLGENKKMGVNSMHIKRSDIEDFVKSSEVACTYLCEGDLVFFRKCIDDYDENVFIQFVNYRNYLHVIINGISFEINK